MSELDEITYGKTLEELKVELAFQLEFMGESKGGTICSHIIHKIEQLENKCQKK